MPPALDEDEREDMDVALFTAEADFRLRSFRAAYPTDPDLDWTLADNGDAVIEVEASLMGITAIRETLAEADEKGLARVMRIAAGQWLTTP